MACLFVSRAVYGIGGGNMSVIQSAIADISDAKSRTKNFGLIGVAFGIGFIVGPALGASWPTPIRCPGLTSRPHFWLLPVCQ